MLSHPNVVDAFVPAAGLARLRPRFVDRPCAGSRSTG